MATKNGVPYRVWLVPSSKYGIKCPYPMNPKKITYHNTDNEMPAQNEVSYLRNNNNQTSYHVAIDEEEAVQALPFNRNGWHAGDGRNGYGNRNTIAIEICRNYDRSRRTTRLIDPLRGMYDKAERNAIKVGAALHKELGIPATLNNIKKHQDWSGKWCPSKILNEARWSAFQVAVIAEYNRLMGQGNKLVSTDVHVVKKGDTLSSIAKKHGTTVEALVKENGIKNPNIISIGQKITLPKTLAKPAAAKVAPKTKVSVTVDGYVGPETVKALQRALGTPVDGVLSLQVRNQATRAFNQKAVTYGTGGSQAVIALQKKIGTTADGYWGMNTTRALQRYLGTPVDGEIWRPSTAIKEMQRRLNNGKF